MKSLVCSYVGRAYWYVQQKEKAIQWLEKAVTIAEKIETAQMPLSIKAQFYATWQDIYRTYVEMLISKGDIDQAFLISERGRNRALFDILSRRGFGIPLSEKYKKLAIKCNYLRKSLAFGNFSNQEAGEIKKQLTALERAMAEELALQSRKQPSTFSLPKGIKQLQKYLKKGQTALIYQLLPRDGIAWAIGKDFVKFVSLPPEKEISYKCRELHASIGDPSRVSTNSNWRDPASWLYDHLIRPFQEITRRERNLIIVPDGDLVGVPFEVFFDTKTSRCLIDSKEVIYVPSVSVLEELLLREWRGPKRVFVVSVSGLPEADSPMIKEELRGFNLGYLNFVDFEAREITSIYGVDRTLWLKDSDATEENVKSQNLLQFGLLHFACHAVMPSDAQWLSEAALILGTGNARTKEDGLLMAREVEQLNLNSDLVVLSACETAGGKFVKGSGYIGMSTSFMAAGAKRVLVSQWKVNDLSTALLMKKFHQNMRNGDSPEKALRRAKLWLRKREFSSKELRGLKILHIESREGSIFRKSLDHPFFWAPFVLVGVPGK